MYLERYNYVIAESFQEYKFYSRGPKGKIEKFVSFALQNLEGKTYLSLTFGDSTEKNSEIDLLSVSNNGDREKILTTIFTIIVDFLNRFPDMAVYAVGSTPSRTRLYQLSITKYWDIITPRLNVYGLRNKSWELFEKNTTYTAFVFTKKQ